ncbi:MAG: hypothetical protein ABJN26_27235 [Stappiaceae bacterium]
MKKLLATLAVSLFATSAALAVEMTEADTDTDGVISITEAQAVVPGLTEEAFVAADLDKDGTLNAEEFAKLVNT